MKKSCLSEDRILTRQRGNRGGRGGRRRLMNSCDGVESILLGKRWLDFFKTSSFCLCADHHVSQLRFLPAIISSTILRNSLNHVLEWFGKSAVSESSSAQLQIRKVQAAGASDSYHCNKCFDSLDNRSHYVNSPWNYLSFTGRFIIHNTSTIIDRSNIRTSLLSS